MMAVPMAGPKRLVIVEATGIFGGQNRTASCGHRPVRHQPRKRMKDHDLHSKLTNGHRK